MDYHQKVSIFEYSPELARQFEDKRNLPHTVHSLTWRSSKKVWWRCYALVNGVVQPDHTWETSPGSRTQKRNLEDRTFTKCPFCLGLRASASYNLAITHPELVKEWHPTKNGDLKPTDLTRGSITPVWWQCLKNPKHFWKKSPNQRTSFKKKDGSPRRSGCIYCPEAGGGRKASEDYSLATEFPHLIKEWHPTKNGDKNPNQFLPNSNEIIFWRCLSGLNHPDYELAIDQRSKGVGCKKCAKIIKPSSKAESCVAFELSTILNIDIDDHTLEIDNLLYDVDIIVRDKKLVIEYDGSFFHKGQKRKDRDIEKNKRLEKGGYFVFRVREHPLPSISKHDLIGIKSNKYYETAKLIVQALGKLGFIPNEEVKKYAAEGKLRKRFELEEYVRKGNLAVTGGKAPVPGRGKSLPEKAIKVEKVMKFVDEYKKIYGKYPGMFSKSVPSMGEESFRNIDAALRLGHRSLPKIGGLPKLIQQKRKHFNWANGKDKSSISQDDIIDLMIIFYENSDPKRFPTYADKDVEGLEGEKWSNLNASLSRGGRGLDKGWSLKKLEPLAMKKMRM